MSNNFAERKPHAVLTPYPVQGHINPMFKLAKLLHLKGFHITFVHTDYNHKRLLKSSGLEALDALPDFAFETIPDGLPSIDGDEGDVSQDIPSLSESVRNNFLVPFRDLLSRLNRSASAGLVPPVTCLVSDFCMYFTIQAAQQLALPVVLLFPASATTFMSFLHFQMLLDRGLDKADSIRIPGMRNFRLKDLPDFIRAADPHDDVMLQFLIEAADRAHGASAIVFNTFTELERDVLSALSSVFHNSLSYTIGPFPSFLNQTPQPQNLASLNSNLWKEDAKCLRWLESKEPGSVVYVNFGSITVMSPEKLLEFAWGLANSNRPFLWIIRPDLVIGGSSVIFSSPEFLNDVSSRGLIASWCPQEQVLNHPSIGGFLTHCGWNSTIESICAGVPMLCWPFFADQPTNCRCICNEWEIGFEINTDVTREEVEKLITELMVGGKGKRMREKTMELKKKAEEDTRPGGPSYMNLDKVIKEVLLKQY